MAQNSSGSLLFINKTSRSASLSNNRSDRISRKRINRHVQQTRDLERERTTRVVHPEPFAPTGTSTIHEDQPATTLPTPPSTPLTSISSLTSSPTLVSDEEAVDVDSPGSELAQVIPDRGTVEPFGVWKLSLDNERYRVLQYFVLEMFPAVSRTDTSAFLTGPTSHAQQAVAQMVRDCLTDEMHTYALLTASTARMKFLTRASFSQLDLPEQYADKTMQLLRKHLSENKPVDERLILTIFFLWAAESYRKNWTAVRTHQEMIKYLYKNHLGGFQNLSYHLRKMLWFGDRFQATATATAPVIEESWAPQGISEAVVSKVLGALQAAGQPPMGTAFTDYSLAFFSQDFRIVVHEVTVLACIVQCHWECVKGSYPDADWVNGRSHAMLDKLLFMKDTRDAERWRFAVLLQDCVRLALITWLAFVGSPTTGVASQSVKDNIKIRVAVDARPLRSRFAALTAQVHESDSMPEDERRSIERLFLWVAGLGGVSSEVKENINWFCDRFRVLAEELDIYSWEAFTGVSHGFLWLDRLEAVNGFRLRDVLGGQPALATGTSSYTVPVPLRWAQSGEG